MDAKTLNRWKVLTEAVQKENVKTVFQLFKSTEIQPILIKGLAIARFYPKDKLRVSGDVDICVAKKDFYQSKKTLAKSGLNFGVDLHKELRHLDSPPFDDLFRNSQTFEIDETAIRILRPEDHLRVLCVHWLTDSGANRERLWDIYYAIEKRPADFDWDRCLNVVSQTRRKWIVCTIALAHRYLNLNVEDTPIAAEIKNPNLIPKWLTKAIEKEWREQVPLIPIATCWNDWTRLKQQIKKRFPPNPVQASIETEAPFNDFPRLPFQIINFFQRLTPSIKQNIKFHRFGQIDVN
jgi:hypothetical protein